MRRTHISLLILVALAVLAFFVFKMRQSENLPPNENQEQEEEVTLETYSNDLLGITLTYPSSLDVEVSDDGRVTFSMLGPSQTDFTELFDGMGVSFFRGIYEAETFDDFVDATIQDWEQNGTITDDLQKVQLADTEGYTFEGTGQGVYRFYLLPAPNTENEAIQIVVFVADPTNQGFQEIVDNMLDSLTIR